MEPLKLTNFLNKELVYSKKIIIVENKGVNVDFLIRDLVLSFKIITLFSWNENIDHYKNIIQNASFKVKSIYENIYAGEIISDHTYVGKKIFNADITSNICIYRDGTANKKDWYNFDLIINVLPPESGVCSKIDGIIIIRTREKIFTKIKYKVHKKETIFF